jgi:hypothetical protein
MNTPRMTEAYARSSRTSDGFYSTTTPMSVYAHSCYEEGCKLERELAAVIEQRDRYKLACDQYSEDEIFCKLHEVTKQRDTLAQALIFVATDKIANAADMRYRAKYALQSLTPKL